VHELFTGFKSFTGIDWYLCNVEKSDNGMEELVTSSISQTQPIPAAT
jgi:hypothetical protein